MVLYLIGLGLGDAKDITVRGLEIVRQCDLVFLESYTSIFWLLGKGNNGQRDTNNEEGNDFDNDDNEQHVQHQNNHPTINPVDQVQEQLQEFYGRSIQLADRDFVESHAEEIYQPALNKNVALLVIGDPVAATTHVDLVLRAKEMGVRVELIHNASIMTACGTCGLQLYHFGQTVSLPFWDTAQRTSMESTLSSSSSSPTPITSWYSKILYNRRGGLHTLCLLDIQMKEPDYPLLAQTGKLRYLRPRFMTVSTAARQLIQAEQGHAQGDNSAYHPSSTLCVGVARLGHYATTSSSSSSSYTETTSPSSLSSVSSLPQPQQRIIAGTLQELAQLEIDQQLGPPLHSLMICGMLHELEYQALQEYILPNSVFQLERHEQETQALMKS
jgi:diphthine synthase